MVVERLLRGIVAVAFLSLACDKGPTDPEGGSYFARVLNEQGQPISGVGMHYRFEVVPKNLLAKRSQPLPTSVISFSLPRTAHVVLTVHRWHTREWLRTLLDTVKGPGTHAVTFNNAGLTNGLYLYRIAYDTTVQERIMALIKSDLADLCASAPFAVTDGLGQLEIPIAMFGFDVPLVITTNDPSDSQPAYIPRSIQIVLVKEGYQTFVQDVSMRANIPPGQDFVLQRE